MFFAYLDIFMKKHPDMSFTRGHPDTGSFCWLTEEVTTEKLVMSRQCLVVRFNPAESQIQLVPVDIIKSDPNWATRFVSVPIEGAK